MKILNVFATAGVPYDHLPYSRAFYLHYLHTNLAKLSYNAIISVNLAQCGPVRVKVTNLGHGVLQRLLVHDLLYGMKYQLMSIFTLTLTLKI